MKRVCAVVALASSLVGAGCGGGAPPPGVEQLTLLAEPGPWGWVSQLIAFRGRLWLANQELGVEHNSADLYSFDPVHGDLRFERHLFSQGVGRPAALGGWLYWPHRDPRFHLGVGLIAATDGDTWRLLRLPSTSIKHVEALLAAPPELIAAASTRRPLLYASDDRGATWRPVAGDPAAEGRVARILELAVHQGVLYGALWDGLAQGDVRTLVRIEDGRWTALPGWPSDVAIRGVAPLGEWLYAALEGSLWRTDGTRSERVGPSPPGQHLRDLVASEGALYALGIASDLESGGTVWRSPDGQAWEPVARVGEGRPHELAILAGRPFVGGRGPGDLGALWGPGEPRELAVDRSPLSEPERPPGEPSRDATPTLDWAREHLRLASLLREPESYADRAGELTREILRLAQAEPPPAFFTGHLDGPFAPCRVLFLEGEEVSCGRLGPWLLLFGAALSGSGGVPLELLQAPWVAPAAAREKYVEPLPAALAALAWSGSAEPEVVGALVARLSEGEDPPWLRGDVVGALRAVTGQPLGYDAQAWRRWWDDVSGGGGEGEADPEGPPGSPPSRLPVP
jgi:hypothetical protein